MIFWEYVSLIPGRACNSSFVAEFRSRSFAFAVDAGVGVFDGALLGVCPIDRLANARNAQAIQPKNAALNFRFMNHLLVRIWPRKPIVKPIRKLERRSLEQATGPNFITHGSRR